MSFGNWVSVTKDSLMLGGSVLSLVGTDPHVKDVLEEQLLFIKEIHLKTDYKPAGNNLIVLNIILRAA